jgi:hypothetical protein
MTEEKTGLRTNPTNRLSGEQAQLRIEVKRIANGVFANTPISMETLAETLDSTRMYIWHLLSVESQNFWPITLDMVLAWSRDPDTRDFARRLLIELLANVDAQIDAQQMRLSDLQRFADSPHTAHNRIAATIVQSLAERYGLIPANTTSTAEVVIKIAK